MHAMNVQVTSPPPGRHSLLLPVIPLQSNIASGLAYQ